MIKKTSTVLGLVLLGLLCVLPACKKSGASTETTIKQSGVDLELPKLDTEFKGASPAIVAAVERAKTAYARGQLAKMMAELDRLSQEPGLNESQKKLVSNLITEMKEVIAKRGMPQTQ